MLQRILTLVLKELQVQFRDRDSRIVLILPVIMQLALFPFAATLEVKNNTLAVYNQDMGSASVELTQRFMQFKAFTRLKMLHGFKEVRDTIDNQRALLVVNFPIDFTRRVKANKPTSIQLIIDGRRSNAAQIAASYIQSVVTDYHQQQSNKVPVTLAIRNWFNPNLDYRWFMLPMLIAIITTIGSMVVTALSVAREREMGTFDQLMVSPLDPSQIMIGKIIPAIIIALLQATIILTASIFIYRIPFQGSFFLLYSCMVLYGVSLSGFGLLISSVSSTQQQALLGVFLFFIPAIALSGFLTPIANMPKLLQYLTWFNPVRHFMVLSKGIYLKGLDLSMAWSEIWSLVAISFLTLGLAYIFFRRHVQ